MASPITGLSAVAADYDLVLCDIWGVLHNGVASFEEACTALERYRAGGGHVLLLSNAPRPGPAVVPGLDLLGVPHGAYDGIVTSGDVARRLIADRPGMPLLHIGAPRDLPLFDGLDAPRVPAAEAAYAVCTNLADDETQTADDYHDILAAMRARGLVLVCANPDLVVERGGRFVPCAGAIGAAYAALGGEVIYAGKPHRPVYDLVFQEAARRWARIDLSRMLAIGDALRTDVAGAELVGIDALFIAHGIHAPDWTRPETAPDTPRDQIVHWLKSQSPAPRYAMERLSW